MRLVEVFFNDRFDIARRNGVQIEDVCDLDLDGFRKWVVGVDVVPT